MSFIAELLLEEPVSLGHPKASDMLDALDAVADKNVEVVTAIVRNDSIVGFLIAGYDTEGTTAITNALEAKVMPIYSNIY